MRKQRWWLPLMAFVFMANWESTLTLPVPDEELDLSAKLLGSSVVTSVSVATEAPHDVEGDISMKTNTADRKRIMPSADLPGSPPELMRPDKFQFFTLNKEGNLVTKQMTEQEIHSLIAAGGGHLPVDIVEPQTVGNVPTGGMKVAEVVQNVQNVLKGELNKPATVMTSIPTIPGHVNIEWSSILPAILGGESESAPANDPGSSMPSIISENPSIAHTTPVKSPDFTGFQTITTELPTQTAESSSTVDYDIVKKPIEILETEAHTEKPMIQVPVIMVDQKLPSHQSEEDSSPIFQILNTISADKINDQNGSHVDEKLGEAYDKETPEKTEADEIISVEPTISKGPVVDEATIINNKVPGMIEINYNSENKEPSVISHVVKPIFKPAAEITNSGITSTLSESRLPPTMTVVSETHSTSMKVAGHEEIPLREPPASIISAVPTVQPAGGMETTLKAEKPEYITEEPSVTSTTETDLKVTTFNILQLSEEKLTENSTILQENLPQAINSNVIELVTNHPTIITPTIGETDINVSSTTSGNDHSSGTSSSIKTPESTTSPPSETTVALIKEEIISERPAVNQEPIYQMIPEIIPDKKTPAYESLPSEVSSVEHIIETLNDPTGNMPNSVVTDHLIHQTQLNDQLNISKSDGDQTDLLSTKKVPEFHTSTPATPSEVEAPVESSFNKPVEPLPTELADSLTSMISQISDAMPSVLPLGESVGLDTTEKKNAINVKAEESETADSMQISESETVPKLPTNSVSSVQLPVQSELGKPVVTSTEIMDLQEDSSQTTTAGVSEVTESVITSSTALPSDSVLTTQLPNIESVVIVENAAPSVNNELLESPVNGLNQAIAQKLGVSVVDPEKSSLETDEPQITSHVASDNITSEVQESTKIESATESEAIVTTHVQETSAEESSIIDTNIKNSISTTVPTDHTETTENIQSDSPVSVPEYIKLEDPKPDMPTQLKQNNTELPIVRLDIKETKPTKFHTANDLKPIKSVNDDMESPLVRIKLTDPVTVVNGIIESSNVNSYLPPAEHVSLPETGSVPANTIASGLIAGFPLSTPSATIDGDLDSNVNSYNPDLIKSSVEVLTANDTPSINVSDAKTTNVIKSNIQGESVSETETQKPKKKNPVNEAVDIRETSTLTDDASAAPEVPLERIDLPKEPVIRENLKESMTAHIDAISQIMLNESKIEEPITEITTSKSTEIESSTILATTTTTLDNQSSSTKLTESVTALDNESSTPISALSIEKAPEIRVNISAASISEPKQPDDESGEDLKTNEMPATSPEMDSATGQPDTMEQNAENSAAVLTELTNSIKSEAPEVKIDVESETVSEKTPFVSQSADVPISETPETPQNLLNDEKIHISHTTQGSQSVTTTVSPDNSSDGIKPESLNVSMQINPDSTHEIIPESSDGDSVGNKLELKKDDNESDKLDLIVNSNLSEKTTESSSINSTPPNTEEVRIQVNDTAVLVTKRPLSNVSSQKIDDVTKPLENQEVKEQTTTPQDAPVTEDSYEKLGEKIQLPLSIELNGLSTNGASEPLDSFDNKSSIVSSEMETRIRLGEEQGVKNDNTNEPITKNGERDSLLPEDKINLADQFSKSESRIEDKPSANPEKDSDSQLSTKVEIVMNMSSNAVTQSSNHNPSVEEKEDPINSSESEKPSTVITENPIPQPTKYAHKPTMNIKKDDTMSRPADDQWTLIPQQAFPALTKTNGNYGKRPFTTEEASTIVTQDDQKVTSTEKSPVPLDHPQSASGLDITVTNLETDITYFTNLCNELAFTFWTATNKGLSTSRSLAVSPFGMTSMLAMVFLGARGPTSDQMNDILKLDDVASFNPHLVFQNVTDAVGLVKNQGIANAAFVRELFADRSKVRKLMPYYKEQAQQFYDGVVTEVNFATISDLVRRRTNLMIRKQTGGRIKDFVRSNTVPLRSPLAALSANVFQTDCNSSAASSEGRDGELYFAVSPAVRQRKLVPIPATVWRAGVLAGYEPSLDATAIALGGSDKLVSTIFVIPGQQGVTAPGDTLDRLEQRLIRGATHDGSWNKLLKVLIPRPGLELQVPKFSHRSVINATAALKRMGLEELFSKHADLKGINGFATDLHLADVLQMNLFSTCGDENIINGRHHVEVYPGSPLRNAREDNSFEEQSDEEFADYVSNVENDLLGRLIKNVADRESRSSRQNDTTEKPRLKLDRPFLYFVRHNPTGLILHMGRFNPRLLP